MDIELDQKDAAIVLRSTGTMELHLPKKAILDISMPDNVYIIAMIGSLLASKNKEFIKLLNRGE